MTERIYIVENAPRGKEEHLLLSDGSAVICVVQDADRARALTARTNGLSLRRHSDLTRPDQKKVLEAT